MLSIAFSSGTFKSGNCFSKFEQTNKNINAVLSEKQGVLPDSVVECVTSNLEAPVLSHNGSAAHFFFVPLTFGKTLHSPSPILMKPRNIGIM